jgi:hypothetical protein
MANELNIAQSQSGQTITAQLFQAGAAIGSAISCGEIGSSKFYSGNMPAASAGTYKVVFYNDTIPVGVGEISWDGTSEIVTAEKANELHVLQGLKSGTTLVVTPTSRTAGGISQTISGDGTTSTTVSRD